MCCDSELQWKTLHKTTHHRDQETKSERIKRKEKSHKQKHASVQEKSNTEIFYATRIKSCHTQKISNTDKNIKAAPNDLEWDRTKWVSERKSGWRRENTHEKHKKEEQWRSHSKTVNPYYSYVLIWSIDSIECVVMAATKTIGRPQNKFDLLINISMANYWNETAPLK